MENLVANTIVAKELTEVEQHKENVLDEVLSMAKLFPLHYNKLQSQYSHMAASA